MPGSNPEKNIRFVLRANTICAASNARESTEEINVSAVRTLNLIIQVTAAAANNVVSVVPQLSFQTGTASPLWVPMGVTDGTVTVNDLATVIAGAGYTRFNFGSQDWRPLDIRTAATDNSSDIILMSIPLNVSAAQKLRCTVAQVDGGSRPSVAIWGAGAS